MNDAGIIEIDGYKLQYRIEGNGPTALVIGSAAYYARSFSKELQNHLRLIFVDWRGFAEASPKQGETTFNTLLDDIEIVRKKLNVKSCVIIGHSAHALLALEYAKKYPDGVSHVVMIGAAPNFSVDMAVLAEHHWQQSASAERKAALEKNIKKLPDSELEKLSPAKRFLAWYIRRDPQGWYDHNFNSTCLWEGISPNMLLFDYLYGIALRDIDITQGLETFKKPIFLALGKYDFIVAPPSSWDPIRTKFQDLTVRVFERSGHSPQNEESHLFNTELMNWISSR